MSQRGVSLPQNEELMWMVGEREASPLAARRGFPFGGANGYFGRDCAVEGTRGLVRPSLTRRATETLAEASGGGVAVLERMIEREQNVASAGKEKGVLEAAIAECERLMKERATDE